MKKKLLIIVYILFIIIPFYALQSMESHLIDEKDLFGFTIEPSFGYLLGQAREIVYDTPGISTESEGSYNGYYLSELIWDLSDIFYIGSTLTANFRNRFYINAGIWTSLNAGSGFMNDYDWVAGVPLHDRDGKENLSHWSLSSVDIVDSMIFDINITYDLIQERKFDISVLSGFKYIYWDWDDTILDSLHAGVEDYLTVGIDGIDYQLELYIPYFGFGGGIYTEKGCFLKGRFIYSPFVIGKAHDHHYRSAHYYDNIVFGQYLLTSVKMGYLFSNHFSTYLQISGQYMFEKKGYTVKYTESGIYSGTYLKAAGIQYQDLSVSFNTAFSF